MGGVDVGGGGKGGRRTLDSEINMIPMIDLLMVTISFLLITAVWVHMSRIDANANVPGSSVTPPCEGADCRPEAKLHVDARDPEKFTLAWKEGTTVVRSVDVPRDASARGRAAVAFPGLAAKIAEEWRAAGMHKDPTDHRFDKAVVHTGNEAHYAEIVAVMDAVAKAKRSFSAAGKTSQTNAFEITFATD